MIELRTLQSWINDGDTLKPRKCGDLTVAKVLAHDARSRFAAGELADGRLIILWARNCMIVSKVEDAWEELNCHERSLLHNLLKSTSENPSPAESP